VFTFKDREKKERAAKILEAHRGQDVMYWGPILREYFWEHEPVAAKELKAALELDLRREEQEATNFRKRADQAGKLGLADLKVKLEEMAADEAGHARELRRLLKGM
jgi:rubrerythrin